MKLIKEGGFTLINVLVAAGLIGGLAVVLMNVLSNLSDGQKTLRNTADEIELRTQVRMILDDERYCRVSLAGDGEAGNPVSPVTFFKEDVDEEGEGLEIELWLSNQAGDIRTTKKLSASDPNRNQVGSLEIRDMKLRFPNDTPDNYEESIGHNDIGEIIIMAQKKINMNTTRELTFRYSVNVGMSTDDSNETTLLTCSRYRPQASSNQTTVLAVHSQTTSNPGCPNSDWNRLWDGYSFLMATGGGGSSNGGDLARAGSCLREFRAMPFNECVGSGSGGECDYYTSGDYSFWLSTISNDEGAVTGATMRTRVSRCTVCEAPLTVLAVHSQTSSLPSCPVGDWEKLWDGYSFFMSSGGGGSSAGQDMSSPGSCLQNFRALPFIECEGPGTGRCDYVTGSDWAFWLSTQSVDEGAVTGAAMRARTGRCSVCVKR